MNAGTRLIRICLHSSNNLQGHQIKKKQQLISHCIIFHLSKEIIQVLQSLYLEVLTMSQEVISLQKSNVKSALGFPLLLYFCYVIDFTSKIVTLQLH